MLTVFGRTFSGLKIVAAVIGLALVIGVGAFAHKVYVYYVAIKSGVADPLMEERLQSSFSHAVANAHVTPNDLAHLYAKTAPTIGNSAAKLTIVEFLDYDCPFSRAAYPAVREMMDKYKDQVQFIIRDFPIEELHPRAVSASLAARCAQDQGKFWPYFDALFIHQDQHADVDLEQYAANLGLDQKKFNACYTGQIHQAQLQGEVGDGLEVGVQGTPTFFFNGIKVQGALNHDQIDLLIQRFLAQASK